MKRSVASLPIRRLSDRFASYVTRLQDIFSAMDRAYCEVAETYRFLCKGCEDNCCRTRFYHHTLLEFCYLHHGWATLEPARRAALYSRAEEVCRKTETDALEEESPLRMCPLNLGDLCGLYEYRPMICRLHGIPHTLQRPDGRKVVGPGCDDFYRQCGFLEGAVLERTPHYAALAALEQEFRRVTGHREKLKLTVAEMILHFSY